MIYYELTKFQESIRVIKMLIHYNSVNQHLLSVMNYSNYNFDLIKILIL